MRQFKTLEKANLRCSRRLDASACYAFKLFRVRKDGTLGSLFINRKQVLPTNVWLKAENYPTKGFKNRKGWHATLHANADHLSLKDREWRLVEVADFKKIKRPKSQGGIWLVANWIKISSIKESSTNPKKDAHSANPCRI